VPPIQVVSPSIVLSACARPSCTEGIKAFNGQTLSRNAPLAFTHTLHVGIHMHAYVRHLTYLRQIVFAKSNRPTVGLRKMCLIWSEIRKWEISAVGNFCMHRTDAFWMNLQTYWSNPISPFHLILVARKECERGIRAFRPKAGLPDFRFFQNRKNVPNQHKMYQMVIKFPKCLKNIPNGHKTYQHFPI
jgi:hypothetical protein